MKRILYSCLAILLATLACAVPATPPATETPPMTEPATEPSTEEPAATNVTCNELALFLDPALASGYDCETILESNEELDIHPEHTLLTLQGYPLTDKFFQPRIAVYPLPAYGALQTDLVNERLLALQALIHGAPEPVFAGSFGISLPFLPAFNAGQVFFADYQVVSFANGSGIRYLTEYAQYYAPVNNHDLFYTYQGVTADEQYWISAILPVNHPLLPANADNPPNGMTWEEFSNNYEPYIADMVNQLNSQPSDSFTPTLTALDALMASMVIQP